MESLTKLSDIVRGSLLVVNLRLGGITKVQVSHINYHANQGSGDIRFQNNPFGDVPILVVDVYPKFTLNKHSTDGRLETIGNIIGIFNPVLVTQSTIPKPGDVLGVTDQGKTTSYTIMSQAPGGFFTTDKGDIGFIVGSNGKVLLVTDPQRMTLQSSK